MSDLYEVDLLRWSERQAELLRRRAAGRLANEQELDWANLAEEIEDVGRSQRIALNSLVRRLLEHLMKLDASPSTDPRRGWEETVRSARADIEDLLEASPSLRPQLGAIITRQLPRARELAEAALTARSETPRVPLHTMAYDAAAVLGGR